MKILELRVMRGPNYWAKEKNQLIFLKIDLEELEREPTHQIEGFTEKLKALIPSLVKHRCTEGEEGGFFKVMEQGTWMGHVIEHVALELQNLAGMDCGFGRTLSTKQQGIYHVLISYEFEEAGKFAVEAAIRICEALAKKVSYSIEDDLRVLRRIARRTQFGPSTASIIQEAKLRGIPFRRIQDSTVVFGYGCRQQKITATVASTTSGMGISLAKNKQATKDRLAEAFIPVPQGKVVYDEDELKQALDHLKFPVVIKPVDGNHGRGITTNINSLQAAKEAFVLAKEESREVIIEEFIEGDDYRLVLVDHRLIAAAKRTPAMVQGDGRSTIGQLIEQVNKHPDRGEGHDNILTEIKIDDITNEILQSKKLTVQSILPKGEILHLKHTANISTGGTAEDVTDQVHPDIVLLAERVSRLIDLNICGIDVLAKDITRPLTRENGGIVEVNAGPGLRMHHHPNKGLPRNIARPIVEMLFPEGNDGRIPLVAVTGTNGKTTTVRLIAHIAAEAGHHKVGFTNTDGIYLQGRQIYAGDCSGPNSAQVVLSDPCINFAVLECARGGILRSGLAFEQCDISIVTNVSEDHLSLKGIDTLEEMAKVKAVVPHTTRQEGHAILNADDDLVYAMREELTCNIALFSLDPGNPRLVAHCEKGGLAATVDEGYLTICSGTWKTRIERIKNIPLSFEGRAEAMIKNLLPAALVAHIRGFKPEKVRKALLSFVPSADQTPGRMNIFKFPGFEVLVDYAHNVDGFIELKKFIDRTEASKKTGIFSVTGDRRNEDIERMSQLSAQMFDEIIIRHDKDMRGRTPEEINELITEAVRKIKQDIPITIISKELDALQYAMDHAKKDCFITLCTDKIPEALSFLNKKMKEEKKETLKQT